MFSSKAPNDNLKPKKFLILRFSSIGDIVLTSSVIRCLKKKFPTAEIHFATKSSYFSILEANPYLSKIHLLDNQGILNLLARLRKENFDEVIDLHNNLRTKVIKVVLGKKSASFNKENLKKLMLVRFKINYMPKVHIVDRYMATVAHLGVENDNLGLDYFYDKKNNISKDFLPITHKNEFCVIAIGGQHFTKKLPLHKLIALCRSVELPIVLVGGKEDTQISIQIANEIGSKVFDTCGQLTINQSASLIKSSLKVYTHDTGMMHIAAAYKKEIEVYWGNTMSDFGMYPYKTQHINHEVAGLECRPCSKIGFDKCPKGHFKCMEQHQV